MSEGSVFRWHWVCPVSTDCLTLSHNSSFQSNPFVLCRTQMPQGGVSSPGVVEALDVLEDRGSRRLMARP